MPARSTDQAGEVGGVVTWGFTAGVEEGLVVRAEHVDHPAVVDAVVIAEAVSTTKLSSATVVILATWGANLGIMLMTWWVLNGG